jgi:hypothetical protein
MALLIGRDHHRRGHEFFHKYGDYGDGTQVPMFTKDEAKAIRFANLDAPEARALTQRMVELNIDYTVTDLPDEPDRETLRGTLDMMRRERVEPESQIEVLENMWPGLRGSLGIKGVGGQRLVMWTDAYARRHVTTG